MKPPAPIPSVALTPAEPKPPVPVPEVTQLGIGLAETPNGQRIALTMTMLLTAADAKQFAAQLAEVAGQMSVTRLVVASTLNGGAGG